tara:strand:+ start:111 stop:545 length:435 start_codon:yes stop_codon:yes gene_type:complete
MANEIKNAKDGLKALVDDITGLKVYDHWPGSVNEPPAAIIMFESRTAWGDDSPAIGGSSFFGVLRMVLLISQANDLEAADELDLYMDPVGDKSIEAKVDGDTTWGGNVDSGKLIAVENAGFRQFQEAPYMAADFVFRFLKQVTT